MQVKGISKQGEYYDSVTLMQAVKYINELNGVIDSAIVMGTKENKSILEASGMLLDIFKPCGDTDLLIAVKAETAERAEQALAEVNTILKSMRKRSSAGTMSLPRSIDAALKLLPEANLALISVAGRYAGEVAMKSLHSGLHVMLFSDNVPLDQEIALKQFAIDHGLLVMGPDCGTAIINGVPLAFANKVNRGNIGIVAAAGTGLQEVSCLISNNGAGISQAIGTGGRDVKQEVGGLMFIEAIKMLLADSNTKVLLLVSKPPHPEVLEKIGKILQGNTKPVVAAFLGANPEDIKKYGIHPAGSLEEAALVSVAYSTGTGIDKIKDVMKHQPEAVKKIARTESSKLSIGQKYIRGLFSGGTFCYEAQLLLHNLIDNIYSNVPVRKSKKLTNSLRSQEHTLIDLGEDEFTVGRPHPMIDYSLRNKRIIEEASDPETAVILLDIVLGFGSNPDPLKDIIPAIETAQNIAKKNNRYIIFVCSVTGTDADPQNRSKVVQGLNDVWVMESNALASLCAGYIVSNSRQ
ncbi:MAG: acyl-CoA synthetase FdrA [bacterium]